MKCIIDVNVLAAANGHAIQIGPADRLKTIDFLSNIQSFGGCVFLDELGLILEEYGKYANHKGQPDVGDAFFKWLHDNQGYPSVCKKVVITAHSEKDFEEFPSHEGLKTFDRNDRKYVAVAVASDKLPSIYNATDSDWMDFQHIFEEIGISIVQLCSPPSN